MTPSWKEQLKQSLLKLRSNSLQSRVALVGVGNLLMGDDAAGMLVIQALKTSMPADSWLSVVEGGPAPENCTGTLRRLQPAAVLFIDAGDMGAAPGEIAFMGCNAAEGVSAFGHALPLSVLGNYLESELGCPGYLLIIQPERIDFDVPVTPVVQMAVGEIVAMFQELSLE